ncbi:MAG TPA: triphosphoribosyl-dephospho-CoA synthase, partial [Burkholderiaceae bacterium]
PGNVRVGAPAHEMTADDFLRSARASAPAICAAGARVGVRVWRAIEETRRVVRCNTNLGIVLLAAPLCRAAEMPGAAHPAGLRNRVERALEDLDRADTELAYRAIRLAEPGGLGTAERYDVRDASDAPAVTLLTAMREAASRDTVARQYSEGFRDVFDLGLNAWRHALREYGDEALATTWTYLSFVAAIPDTHIQRKRGTDTAQAVAIYAKECLSRLAQSTDRANIVAMLARWDLSLKTEGLNPGTSADLTVATIFAAKLARA